MKIQMTFLGTGQAVPTANRNHSAILLEYKNENILIDCGEGTQRQFRIAKINPCKLTRILITHWHGDHILGLPGLLQTLTLNNYNKKLQITIPRGTKHFLDTMLKMFAFQGKINLEVKEISDDVVEETKDFLIETKTMSHSTICNAYSFIEKDKKNLDKKKLKQLGLLNNPLCKEIKEGKDIVYKGKKIRAFSIVTKEKGEKITIALDTTPNNNLITLSKNSDLLVLESTYIKSEENTAKEYKHMTSEQAAIIAKKLNVGKLILTHISQRYEHKTGVVLKEAKKIFKNTQVAEDFMRIEV